MTLDLWILLGIALVGWARVHYERRADAIARRAKQVSSLRDYA
jgi:hypothetical protein